MWGHSNTSDSISEAWVINNSRTWLKSHQRLDVPLDLVLLAFELSPGLLPLQYILTLQSIAAANAQRLGWMERSYTSEEISLFGALFSDDLSSQIAQVVADFGVLHS